MKKVLRRRPSAAMLVAIVALVAALAGTAVAGGGFLTKKKFNKFKSNAVQRLTYVNNTVSVPASTGSNYTKVSADCPAGLHPVGGGVSLSPNNSSYWWGDGYLTATGYAAHVYNGITPSTTPASATVTVSCVAGNASGTPAAS